jgi:hypothetical protein
MLKRNGQYGRHSVPHYAGRLTDDEYEAYKNVSESLSTELADLASVSDAVRGIEKDGVGHETPSVESKEIVMDSGDRWRILRSLVKLSQSEVCLCQKGAEFAVIERFAETSTYAKSNGAADIALTGNNERQVLQDFVENERQTLRLFADDLMARVREGLSEKYPQVDCRRVEQAIEDRCNAALNPAQVQTQAVVQEIVQTRGLKV